VAITKYHRLGSLYREKVCFIHESEGWAVQVLQCWGLLSHGRKAEGQMSICGELTFITKLLSQEQAYSMGINPFLIKWS
jgi:hypothetical protein